eukprot:7420779-Pyramimonas_sp.AAC.1
MPVTGRELHRRTVHHLMRPTLLHFEVDVETVLLVGGKLGLGAPIRTPRYVGSYSPPGIMRKASVPW